MYEPSRGVSSDIWTFNVVYLNKWNYKIYRINIETETTKEKLLKRMKQYCYYCTFSYR